VEKESESQESAEQVSRETRGEKDLEFQRNGEQAPREMERGMELELQGSVGQMSCEVEGKKLGCGMSRGMKEVGFRGSVLR
jgi:hypothetical protein